MNKLGYHRLTRWRTIRTSVDEKTGTSKVDGVKNYWDFGWWTNWDIKGWRGEELLGLRLMNKLRHHRLTGWRTVRTLVDEQTGTSKVYGVKNNMDFGWWTKWDIIGWQGEELLGLQLMNKLGHQRLTGWRTVRTSVDEQIGTSSVDWVKNY